MKLSQISIQRPVLATVMTLLLVLCGVLSFTRLSVREYPDIDRPIVSVRTVYPGASAQLVETDVTTVLEDALSGIAGLRTAASISREETSRITLEFETVRDLDGAANDVRDRVFRIRRQLPLGIEDPIVAKEDAEDDEVLFLALSSDRHSELELTDFAERHIKSRLAILPGVSSIYLDGERRYAMRIWLDKDRLASRRLAVQDVEEALHNQNARFPSGRIEGELREFSVNTGGELQTAERFNRLIVAQRDGYPVRLGEVGRAELGPEDDRKRVRVNGKPSVGLAVVKQSQANTLTVGQAVKREVASLQSSLPHGMMLTTAFDSSLAIERSIHDVYVAMGISVILVVLIIFLFLRTFRATLIPAVAIPTSIISAFFLLHLFGYSINVLTLLGLVLAIGLVVDDAIVMLENIHRRIERGEPPGRAALEGSREIAFAVLATTLSLIAVFVPIAFLTGTIGRLFAELSVAVAGSVLVSGFLALTLTPMMCAKVLRPCAPSSLHSRPRQWFTDLSAFYGRALEASLQSRGLILLTGAGAMVVALVLLVVLPAELAPLEDDGWFVGHVIAPEGSTIRYTDQYTQRVEAVYDQIPELHTTYTVVGRGTRPTNVTRAAIWTTLTDWGERRRSQREIIADVASRMAEIPGVRAFPNSPPPLNQSANKTPVQFVIGGQSYEELERSASLILAKVRSHPSLTNIDTDLDVNKPELMVQVQRDKASDLGISIAAIGRTLETMLGGRPVTTFIRDDRAYNVVVKIQDQERVKPSDIGGLYVRGHENQLIPLANVVAIQEKAVPQELHHHDKMRAVTISAGLGDGYSLGESLAVLDAAAQDLLPAGSRVSYAGESKEFKEATGGLLLTFVLALLVVYLVLAAQFESFIHPLTILLAVPSALMGALLALKLFGGTLNIYSEIGMVILVGLVTKNAILIVEFANQLRARGIDAMRAVVQASVQRLRPILMTTLATILGALPLALSMGPGAASRQQIGYTVIAGLLFSTVLTLFLVPVVYTLLSRQAVQDSCRPDARTEPLSELLSPIES